MAEGSDLYRSDRRTVVVALGGNALTKIGETGTISELEANADQMAGHLMPLLEADYNLVITHGNGPQVGALLLRNDLCKDRLPTMPLDVLVAETQGSIGYFFQQALLNRLRAASIRRYVVTMITQVVVDPEDPAFQNPNKPIGLYYDAQQARQLEADLGWTMKEVRDGKWRRVVPSPRPVKVIQRHMIRHSMAEGNIVIAGGGGGVPIRIKENGNYEGIEAVIDKDLCSAEIARQIRADLLVILTVEPFLYEDYGTPSQRAIEAITTVEARKLLAAGQFPPGTVGPKAEACIGFVEATGGEAVVTEPSRLAPALRGETGTRFLWAVPQQ